MFESLAYYRLDELLSEDEKMGRTTSRQFVEDKIMSIIRDYHRKAKFPKEHIQEMGNLGLFGVTLPENMTMPE